MSVLKERPTTHLPPWEPEPLHLPVDDLPSDRERRRRRDDQDVTGSHVVVIDLA